MANNRHGNRVSREFFTLGEHTVGSRSYRFRYDGRIYRILEQQPEQEETLVLEEADSHKAYEAWNRIKRPERFGGMAHAGDK